MTFLENIMLENIKDMQEISGQSPMQTSLGHVRGMGKRQIIHNLLEPHLYCELLLKGFHALCILLLQVLNLSFKNFFFLLLDGG